jgi:tripartite-type tricarboxylate transporter receptor subunit TctC
MVYRVARTALLAVMLCAGATSIHAQTWPQQKPIKFEVTAAAGGLIDFAPRLIGKYLGPAIGQSVVVENRPGGGGNVAAAIVAKAEPDGHSIVVTGSNQAVNPTLLPNPGFDYDRDLVPVSMVVNAKMLLVASPNFAAKSITEVIRMAKEKPKSVSIAISPIGTPNHLGAEMLAQLPDIDLTFVPYGGIAQSTPDVMAGRVDLAIAAIPSLLPHVQSGSLKAMAVTSATRSDLAPDIPTSAESGLPGLQIDAWILFMTTGGTPPSVVAQMDREIGKILALPEVKESFAKQGVEIMHMGPDELGRFLKAESARFASLLKNSRVKAPAK